MKIRLLISIVSLCAAACGPSGSTGGGTQTDVCASYATNYCNRLAACSTYRLGTLFGDVDGCIARMKPICATVLQAPGTGLDAATYGACATAYSTASCDDLLLAGWKPPACKATGTLAEGAACGHNAQCASGYCKVGYTQVCGTCTPLVASGGSCTRSEDCQEGLGCVSPGMCGAVAPLGAGCRTIPCDPRLVCINLICERRLTLDAACVPQDFGICDLDTGLYCDSATMRCAATTLAPNGASCTGGVGVVACIAGGCGVGTPRVCEPATADGAACNSELPCRYPAICVSAVCRVPDPTTCH
jgi:hypothetical protein